VPTPPGCFQTPPPEAVNHCTPLLLLLLPPLPTSTHLTIVYIESHLHVRRTPSLLELFIIFLFLPVTSSNTANILREDGRPLLLLWMVLLTHPKKIYSRTCLPSKKQTFWNGGSNACESKAAYDQSGGKVHPWRNQVSWIGSSTHKAFLGKRISIFRIINISKSMSCICICP
jgi:hypothetical protein